MLLFSEPVICPEVPVITLYSIQSFEGLNRDSPTCVQRCCSRLARQLNVILQPLTTAVCSVLPDGIHKSAGTRPLKPISTAGPGHPLGDFHGPFKDPGIHQQANQMQPLDTLEARACHMYGGLLHNLEQKVSGNKQCNYRLYQDPKHLAGNM